MSRWLRCLVCFALVALSVLVFYRGLHVNATTAALVFVLLVLAAATRWGLAEAVFTSVVAVLAFNFFFLPPIGTFTIADSQNWVALFTFLVTAVTVGQLSARARKRTAEASARRAEVERLYSFSRSMLLADPQNLLRSSLHAASGVFAPEHITFYDQATGAIHGETEHLPFSPSDLAQTSTSQLRATGVGYAIVPVELGTRPIGSLGFTGGTTSEAEQRSVANLIAINFARSEALEKAAFAEAARRGERLKTAILDGIAHDLKTPLTAIKTCITTLTSMPPRSEEKRSELLTIIDEETNCLQDRLSGAIQLARFESDNVELKPCSLPLSSFIHGVLQNFADPDRFLLDIRNTTITVDAMLLQGALKQIVENAVKYGPPRTPIEIQAAKENGQLRIAVLDQGRGIDPADCERIFEKFYRGANSASEREGTGLGLWVAAGIVQSHGGTVTASNRPNGGASISVTIPQRR